MKVPSKLSVTVTQWPLRPHNHRRRMVVLVLILVLIFLDSMRFAPPMRHVLELAPIVCRTDSLTTEAISFVGRNALLAWTPLDMSDFLFARFADAVLIVGLFCNATPMSTTISILAFLFRAHRISQPWLPNVTPGTIFATDDDMQAAIDRIATDCSFGPSYPPLAVDTMSNAHALQVPFVLGEYAAELQAASEAHFAWLFLFLFLFMIPLVLSDLRGRSSVVDSKKQL